jgi:hypothetical protein
MRDIDRMGEFVEAPLSLLWLKLAVGNYPLPHHCFGVDPVAVQRRPTIVVVFLLLSFALLSCS